MAQTRSTRPVQGFSRLAGPLSPPTTRTFPAGIILQDSDGYDWYFWPKTDGTLRYADAATAEADGFNWNSGGSPV